MNNTKGLSQILYLIIAASVLMIAALSMVFMLNEGLSGVIDFGGQADTAACENAVRAQCAGGAATVSTPNTCLTTNANGQEQVVSGVPSYIGPNSATCQ